TILEEEYQESFGFNDHSESVPSILRKITPPRLSDPPPGTAINRHSTYNPSRAHHYHHHPSSFVAPPTTSDRGDSIYNEPCDAKRRGCSPKKSAFRRASLATTIYCDTEHHRESYHAASPQDSPDSLKLNANNHLRDASGSSGFVAVNGRRSGTNSHGARCWWEQDSGSSSLSNSRDVSSHNNPKFEHSSAAASNTEKPAESGTRTLSPSHKTSAPTVSSLEQALRIARGQVEEEVFPVANEQVNYQSPNAGFLPRIPEYGEGTYTAAQVERLKAGVVRRTNSRSDRSEFNSAPPGIYWPDGETTGAHPQTPHHQAPAFGPVDRLPRIAPLSRPTSSVFFGGPRSPVTSFCASPTRAVSPTPFLHRPLPPPPFADRRGDKMSKSFNLGATAGPMWRAVPLKSPTAELEVVDTAVYSNVKIPVLR
uniref:ZM domain-containing protein n=1 Tax=Mesocestoides corti TaxID=53468 RepID=A0A5K3F4A7_MESCO